jgi:hypothetical protein
MANRILITRQSQRNSCHTDCFFINSKSTLSHGARNFYFNLSPARSTTDFFFLHSLMHKCRAVNMRPNLIGITCRRTSNEKLFRYRTRFICVSSYAGGCQSSKSLWCHYGQFRSVFLEFAVGGKTSIPLKWVFARALKLILRSQRHSSLPFPLKHYCLSKLTKSTGAQAKGRKKNLSTT